MNIPSKLPWVGLAGAILLGGGIFFGPSPSNGPLVIAQDAVPDANIEVQASGPLHEAFAEPVSAQARAAAVIAQKPPEPINELPAEQKPEGDNVQWIGGYWAFADDRNDFLWISGFWRDIPPDRQWVPGYWAQARNGFQWVPGFWAQAQAEAQAPLEIQYVPELPASIETGPSTPAPGNDYFYNSGIWVYQQQRYFWRTGYWARYQPNWVWTPAHYVWNPSGNIFVEGFWDYPLERRGVLFAPVAFQSGYVVNSYYRPRYFVQPSFLTASLFVRNNGHHYHFGNYYSANHAQRGYVPWFDARYGQKSYDPLFSYYRHTHQDRTRWEADLRTTYTARRNGQAPLPPRTLKEQNNSPNVQNNITVLTSLQQADPQVFKFRTVQKTEVQQVQKNIENTRLVQQERRKAEVAGQPQSGKAGTVVKLNLPDQPRPVKTSVQTPKLPFTPQAVVGQPTQPKTSPKDPVEPKKVDLKKPLDPKGTPPVQPKELPKATDPKKPVEPKELPKPIEPKKPFEPKVNPPVQPKELPKPVEPKKPLEPKVNPPVQPKELPKQIQPPKEAPKLIQPPKEAPRPIEPPKVQPPVVPPPPPPPKAQPQPPTPPAVKEAPKGLLPKVEKKDKKDKKGS